MQTIIHKFNLKASFKSTNLKSSIESTNLNASFKDTIQKQSTIVNMKNDTTIKQYIKGNL